MLLVFGFRLQWFPRSGSVGIGLDSWSLDWILSRLYHMFLPALTAALLSTIGIIQYLRTQIIAMKYSDYVTTARSKGVPEAKVYTRHLLRNAFIPIAANIGFLIVTLVGGSVLIETIFMYPGMGHLFVESINNRDFTVVNAIVMMMAALTVVGALLSDIILTIVDPRIRIR
jgi:peptide/nickel transport system permease protein